MTKEDTLTVAEISLLNHLGMESENRIKDRNESIQQTKDLFSNSYRKEIQIDNTHVQIRVFDIDKVEFKINLLAVNSRARWEALKIVNNFKLLFDDLDKIIYMPLSTRKELLAEWDELANKELRNLSTIFTILSSDYAVQEHSQILGISSKLISNTSTLNKKRMMESETYKKVKEIQKTWENEKRPEVEDSDDDDIEER